MVVCSLYADPHVQGFSKKYYNAQVVGDWVLYKGHHMAAHYRGKSMGSWVGAIKFGVRIHHHRIFTVDFALNALKIDGRVVSLSNGEIKVGKRGTIVKSGNQVTFKTNMGEELDIITFGSYFNAYVRSRATKVSGLCSEQFIKSRFFDHPHAPKDEHIKLPECKHKKLFEEKCRKMGHKKKGAHRACVFDLCAGMKERIVKKILRHTKRIKKTKVHIKKSLIKDMRVNRQTCQLYADPHVHGFSGKNYNAQTVGDWVLYKGKNLSAHYRGKSMGVWVGAIKFGIHLFHHYKIYTIGFKFDKLLINDKVKKITSFISQQMMVKKLN